MVQVSSNNDINKLIGYFNGNIALKNALGMNKIKKIIDQDPSSKDLCILRDELYKRLLENGKNILLLEKELLNTDYKKQEKRLNIYRSICNCNFDFAVVYWSSLLGLTEECNSIYDYIKNFGMYADLDNKNEFYQELNKFIIEEGFNETVFNSLMSKKKAYPSEAEIKNNFKLGKNSARNCTKEVGIYGELCSYRFTKQELVKAKKENLAERTIWVARDIGDFFGFDLSSFDENEEELILEVKATNSKLFEKEKDNFYVTQNEFQKMKELKEEYNYFIVRVYIDEKNLAHLFYLKPNDDMSVEYGDIKYVPQGISKPNKIQYEYKRVPKKKVFKLD